MIKISNKYSLITMLIGGLAFSGCATNNAFAVGYEKSACESSSKGGFCGSPSAIYEYKKKVIKIQEDYKSSGFPDDLFFSIKRDGSILVKAERDDKWQPYSDSRYEEEINSLLKLKFSKNSTSMDSSSTYSTTDLSKEYDKKMSILRTTTNVGEMIRDSGKYTRTWVAPHVDIAGDLISAHELYIVLEEPKWVIGENTPKKTLDASSSTPFSGTLLNRKSSKVININNKSYNTKYLEHFLKD